MPDRPLPERIAAERAAAAARLRPPLDSQRLAVHAEIHAYAGGDEPPASPPTLGPELPVFEVACKEGVAVGVAAVAASAATASRLRLEPYIPSEPFTMPNLERILQRLEKELEIQ
jgi:hypothetical protein